MKKTIILAFILTSALAAANIIVDTSNSDPSPAQAGSDLFITILLQNYGDTSADQVATELVTNPPFSLKVETERNQNIDMLCSKCFKELDYHLFVDSGAKSGEYPTKLKVNYKDLGLSRGLGKDITITVRSYKQTVGIDKVILNKDHIEPGDHAQLDLKIKNYGIEDISKLELTLTAPTETTITTAGAITKPVGISIIGSTKKFFTDTITAGSSVNAVYDIYIDDNAEVKSYQLPVAIKITDKFGNEQTLSDTLGIDVTAVPKVSVTVKDYDPKAGKLEVLVANRGQAKAKYTVASVSGISATPSEAYIGNLDPDDYSTAQFTFTPKDAEVTVSVKYMDTKNVEQTLTTNYKVYTVPSDNTIVYVVVVILIVAAVYWFFIRKKKKE